MDKLSINNHDFRAGEYFVFLCDYQIIKPCRQALSLDGDSSSGISFYPINELTGDIIDRDARMI